MAGEVLVAREGGVNPINAIKKRGGTDGDGFVKEGREQLLYHDGDKDSRWYGFVKKEKGYYRGELPNVMEKTGLFETEKEAKDYVKRELNAAIKKAVDATNKDLERSSERFSEGKALTSGFIESADFQKDGTLNIYASRKTYRDSDRGRQTNLTVDRNGRISGKMLSGYTDSEIMDVLRVVNRHGMRVKRINFSEGTWVS